MAEAKAKHADVRSLVDICRHIQNFIYFYSSATLLVYTTETCRFFLYLWPN